MKKTRERNVMMVIIRIIMIIRTKEMKWFCEGCLESEKIGLLQINSSIFPNPSWDIGNDCCDWERVECDSATGHVTKLDFYYVRYENSENWYLNASLFLPFRQLNQLDLKGNNINGCIHNEGFERLSTLRNLEDLDLRQNNFNNSILQSLSGLPSLKSLDLAENKLNGTLNLAELNNLTNTLQMLWLNENQIEGFESIQAKLSKLDYLQLSENRLKSNSLSALSGLSSLTSLGMSSNQFKGPFNLTDLNGMSSLQDLDLSTNEITSFISNGGGKPMLNKLETLYLDFNPNNKTTNLIQSIGIMKSLTTLRLRGCGVSGNIQGLCELKYLEDLDLNDNNLSGNLPWCLTNLTSLYDIDLSSNQFSGNISLSPFKSLTSLSSIELSHNHFRIPLSLTPFFNLSELRVLNVGGNSFYEEIGDPNMNPKFQLVELSLNGYGEGESIPKFLHRQYDLQQLHISDLKLKGNFPNWILENNTRLEVLNLANNSFSGDIQLHNITCFTLAYLDMSDNFFTGHIPSHIGGYFRRLGTLGLSKNDLEGAIPDSLCDLTTLFLLDLSQNNIFGTIPKCIGNMSRLEILDLSGNNISGTLPSDFSPFILEVVNLSKNKLRGSLNDAFFSCIKLLVLDLSHNNLSGSIPLRIGKLPQLSFLFLGYNKLQGLIPNELCKLKQLSFLDLSHNSIFGHVLPCLNITSAWSRQQIISQIAEPLEITMKGQIYSYAEEILSYVTGIDLSCNNFTGQIPSAIGDLRNAKALNLSGNYLTGPIPPSFSNMKENESLDLSRNNLQGPIPHQLTSLTSLAVFDVSYNNLSGQTPGQVAQFASFSESSFEGNPFLCGRPLSRSCGPPYPPPSNSTNAPSNEKSNNDFIDIECFYLSFGIAYATVLLTLVTVLCINPYWRRVWFYYVKMSVENTCYYIIDNVFPLFSRF